MKIIKWIIYAHLIALLLVLVIVTIITPAALIGFLILIYGIYQKRQQDKGKLTFSKPWIIILVGFLIWIRGLTLVETTNEVTEETQEIQKEENNTEETAKKTSSPTEEKTQTPEPTISEEESIEEKTSETVATENEPSEKVEAPQVDDTVEEKLDTTNETSVSNSGNDSSSSTTDSFAETSTDVYESYQNCTALRAVYPSGVGQDHPAYAPKHDRDNDGWACER